MCIRDSFQGISLIDDVLAIQDFTQFPADLAELVQDRAALFVQKEPQCAAAPTPFTPELNVDYFHSARARQGRREFPNTGGGRIHPLAPETKKAGIAHFESDS